MLSDNILILRNLNGYSQEEVAEKIGISRQAYAKWEKGETIPDVERCMKLADLYGTTIDALVRPAEKIGNTVLSPGPRGKHIFGTVKVNSRGQIVIPKAARELFDIKKDDTLVVLADESEGIALIKTEVLEQRLNAFYDCSRKKIDE